MGAVPHFAVPHFSIADVGTGRKYGVCLAKIPGSRGSCDLSRDLLIATYPTPLLSAHAVPP